MRLTLLLGRGEMEDPAQMLQRYPDWNDYWEDKRADFSKINVPAYILASYSTGIHTEGSLRCFEELKTPKWCESCHWRPSKSEG